MITSIGDTPSTRPYLIRALYEWCTDHGFTPYVAVMVDASVQVPMEYVRNGEIVLNISAEATSSLKLGNDFIEFKARFAGTAREIMVPVDHVIAIYARENGQGMAFPTPQPVTSAGPAGAVQADITPKGKSTADARGMQLIAGSASDSAASASDAAAASPAGTASDGTEPEPPRPAGGARPALKRIK